MNISIAGDLGSGKSSVSNILRKRGYSYISCGSIMRDYGKKHNISVLDVNKLAMTDPSIDKYIDDRQIDLGKKRTKTIFDGRMSWYFVPNSFKVYITVDRRLAAERILNAKDRTSEKYNTIDEALNAINERQNIERLRYNKIYGVDVLDYNNYDLVIDSSDATPNQIASEILRVMKIKSENDNVFIEYSPYRIYPTQNTRDLNMNVLKEYRNLYKKNINNCMPICCSVYDNNIFVLDGHHRLLAHILNKKPFIKVFLNNSYNKELIINKTYCYDFEDIGNFKYRYIV